MERTAANLLVVHRLLILLAVLAPIAAASLAFDANAQSSSQDYEVYIEPGLTPELSPSQLVPKLPAPFGGMRMGGTIEAIDRVALVLGQHVPDIDSSLQAEEADVPVWVVLLRGKFYFSGPGDYSATATRGYYLIHHKSGVAYSVGLLRDGAANADPPAPAP